MSEPRDEEFADRTALVTGGSRGIGRAICLRLARTGARIALNYAANTDAACRTRDAVIAAGARCRIYRADVSDRGQVARMVGQVAAELGPVDLLVTNAGIARSADGAAMSAETWHEILSVNLDGTFHPVWQVKDGMTARGFGRIVCVASVLGLAVNPITPLRQIAYGTSKAAVIAFVRNCAAAFGPALRVNCVAPGFIETDMTADVSDEARRELIKAAPLGRFGRPDEIAELVYFLLSERSSFTTGQTYVSSGGAVTLP